MLFTPEQRVEVDKILDILARQSLVVINAAAPTIKLMDHRPVGAYDPTDENDGPEKYRFEYVPQGMLEDLIERLQEQV